MNILNSGRFSMGSSSAGMIKKLIGKKINNWLIKRMCKIIKRLQSDIIISICFFFQNWPQSTLQPESSLTKVCLSSVWFRYIDFSLAGVWIISPSPCGQKWLRYVFLPCYCRRSLQWWLLMPLWWKAWRTWQQGWWTDRGFQTVL